MTNRPSATKCNFSSPQEHQHWLISRSPKVAPKSDSGFSSSKSTNPEKKRKDRLHFCSIEECHKPTSSPDSEEDEEGSLRRVSAYSRHFKSKPLPLVFSDDEGDFVAIKSPSALSEVFF